MKINLAENMLRFGAKNLTETSKRMLQRLAEQATPSNPAAATPGKPAPIVKAAPKAPLVDWSKFTTEAMVPFVNRFMANEQDKDMPLVIGDMFILFNSTNSNQTAFGRKALAGEVFKFLPASTNMGQLPVITRVGKFGVHTLKNTATKQYPGQIFANELESAEGMKMEFRIETDPAWNNMQSPTTYINLFGASLQTINSTELIDYANNHDYTPYITSIQKATDVNLTTKKINPEYLGHFFDAVKAKRIPVINKIVEKLQTKPQPVTGTNATGTVPGK